MSTSFSASQAIQRSAGGPRSQSQKLTRNNYVELQGCGFDWLVHRRLNNFVSQQLFENWNNIAEISGAEIVKENAHRSVYRMQIGGTAIFLKRFRLKTLTHHAKALFVPSKAKTEWKHANKLYNAGVSTAQPALVAEHREYGALRDATVAFFEVPNSTDYAKYLDKCRAETESEGIATRRTLLHNLAELTHQLFELGALHYDFHLGNVLVDGDGKLYVIDLDAVRFVSRVFRQQKLHVIAKMALSHAPFDREKRRWARDEVQWYCESYSRLDSSFGTTTSLIRQVLDLAWKLEQQRLKSRDKRCLVSSTLYSQKRSFKTHRYFRRGLDSKAMDEALKASPVQVLHQNKRGCVELVKAPKAMRELLRQLRGAEASEFVVRKTSFARNTTSLLGTAFTGSKGMRSWRAARGFEVRNLPTALHLALHEERSMNAFTSKSVVFMEYLENVFELHKYLQAELGAYPGPTRQHWELRQLLARRLADLLVKVQETGVSHHDLAVQNVLVRPIFATEVSDPSEKQAAVKKENSRPKGESTAQEDSSPNAENANDETTNSDLPRDFELFLVDLDSVRLRRVSAKDLLRNLVHVGDLPEEAVSRDKIRFLDHYLRNGGQDLLKGERVDLTRRELIKEIDSRWHERREAKAKRMAAKQKP